MITAVEHEVIHSGTTHNWDTAIDLLPTNVSEGQNHAKPPPLPGMWAHGGTERRAVARGCDVISLEWRMSAVFKSAVIGDVRDNMTSAKTWR